MFSVVCLSISLSTSKGSHVTIYHDALDPCHLLVTSGGLFKLVQLRTHPPVLTSGGLFIWQAGGTHPTVMSCYRPQQSCEGYVFTGVCLSTGGMPDQVHPHKHPPDIRNNPLGLDTPPSRVPPGAAPHPPGTLTRDQHTPLPGTSPLGTR